VHLHLAEHPSFKVEPAGRERQEYSRCPACLSTPWTPSQKKDDFSSIIKNVPTRKQIPLIDGATRGPVAATLIEDVSEQELQAVDALRGPYTADAKREALKREVLSGDLPEHGHWRWGPLYATEDRRFFGIECDGEMQALMLVRTDKSCRLAGQAGLPLIYVDRLATAPWNYGKFLALLGRAPRYRKAGDLLS